MNRRSLLAKCRQLALRVMGGLALPVFAQNTAKPVAVSGSATAAGLTEIHPWVAQGTVIKADLLVDGVLLGKIDHTAASDNIRRAPLMSFQWPSRGRKLLLRGTWTKPGGQAQSFNRSWSVVDIGPYTASFYNEALPIDERFASLTPQVGKLYESNDELVFFGRGVVTAEPNPAGAVAQLEAFERKMNLRLPTELRTLMRQHVRIGDKAYFVRPKDLKSVAGLLTEWGGSLDRMSPALRARYERSVGVFIEIGDGHGLLGWDPLGVTVGESSNLLIDKGSAGAQPGNPQDGVWFWLHEGMVHEPQLLLNRKMQPANASQALINVVQRFLLNGINFEMTENFGTEAANRLVVDRSNPMMPLKLYLTGKKETPELRRDGGQLSFIFP